MSVSAIVVGWPAVIISLMLTTAGIAVMRWPLVVAGALVGSPFLCYLFSTPRFRLVALPVALMNFAAAYAVARGYRPAAIALVVPFALLSMIVARLVLAQFAG